MMVCSVIVSILPAKFEEERKGERERDVLTVRIHFKVWQRANGRATGRQIKQGPSQQVVLGQIGCDSVQPLNILPAGQHSRAVTEQILAHIFVA